MYPSTENNTIFYPSSKINTRIMPCLGFHHHDGQTGVSIYEHHLGIWQILHHPGIWLIQEPTLHACALLSQPNQSLLGHHLYSIFNYNIIQEMLPHWHV